MLSASKSFNQHAEDCEMHRSLKLEPRREAVDPTDTRLQGFQRLEFYPDDFIKSWALNELHSAAML